MADQSRYRTDLTEMRQLVDRAAQIQQRIEAHPDQIQHRMDALHVNWTGKAATAHADAHQRWQQAARDMHDDLGDMHSETHRAHANYSGVIDHHRRMWPQS